MDLYDYFSKFLFITGAVLLKAFLRDFKEIIRLTSPVYPEIVPVVQTKLDEGNLPCITSAIVSVNDINEDLQIIDIQQVVEDKYFF